MSEEDNRQQPEEGHELQLDRPTEDKPDTQDSGDQAQENPTTSNIPPATPPRSHTKQVWKGIGLLTLLHLLVLIFPVVFFAIGIVQIIYLLPALIICRNNTGMVQGLLIAAGITFLLNAACFGIVMFSFN
jgi:hypothetical protein